MPPLMRSEAVNTLPGLPPHVIEADMAHLPAMPEVPAAAFDVLLGKPASCRALLPVGRTGAASARPTTCRRFASAGHCCNAAISPGLSTTSCE